MVWPCHEGCGAGADGNDVGPRVWRDSVVRPHDGQPLTPPQTSGPSESIGRISIEAAQVPLNPQDPAATTLGQFRYAGGLVLTSTQTARLHELSDIVMTGQDRFAAVGDEGIFLEARLVLDSAGQLVSVTDASISPLVDQTECRWSRPTRMPKV